MCTYAFSLHTSPPSTSVQICFFKDMTELPSIKEPENSVTKKRTTVQSYQKMLNKNIKSHGIKVALYNCTWEIGMDNSGCLNKSLSLFLFCNKSAKRDLWHTYTYS